jgi:hypothetical protein
MSTKTVIPYAPKEKSTGSEADIVDRAAGTRTEDAQLRASLPRMLEQSARRQI